MLHRYNFRDYNYRLVLWLIALTTMGVLLVSSANPAYRTRQFAGVILGFVVMIVVSLFDYSWVLNFQWIIYGFNLVMLAGVVVYGRAAKGATRWIQIGGFRFQPVELSKIMLILFFAKFFHDHQNDLNKPRTILQAIALIGAPLALIFMQPDLKNTITVFVIFALMYFAAGLSYKFIAAVVAIIIPLAVGFMLIVIQPDQPFLKDYQRDRIMTFLYPDNEEYTEDTVQQRNSITAIGSGELSGKGLNNSEVDSVIKGRFVSESHNDFIFAVVGEELGFLGSIGIILLLLLVSYECLLISAKAKDLAGKIISCGVGGIVAVQSFLNISVATGILPNTGTPLPFISYGLTSLVSLFIGMGFVLNIGMQSRIRIGGLADE
ncbi:MAG: rod shape-determining protein RodA [Lachnospiraceae bacterium]|nr:rod shape-determining protein RodA [Lachnospiraceae bacterium]